MPLTHDPLAEALGQHDHGEIGDDGRNVRKVGGICDLEPENIGTPTSPCMNS